MAWRHWIAATATTLALGIPAQAALQDRGGGLIYDDVLDITWLADWNLLGGGLSWEDAVTWASDLVYRGYDDWRLPTALNADGSGPCDLVFDCSGSEMGHMFYNNWGAVADRDFSTGSNAANLALFSNVQSFGYWTSTEDADDTDRAWIFITSDGRQGTERKSLGFIYAVAVRDGDVAAIPEPSTIVMLIAGLGVLGAMARRRAATTGS